MGLGSTHGGYPDIHVSFYMFTHRFVLSQSAADLEYWRLNGFPRKASARASPVRWASTFRWCALKMLKNIPKPGFFGNLLGVTPHFTIFPISSQSGKIWGYLPVA